MLIATIATLSQALRRRAIHVGPASTVGWTYSDEVGHAPGMGVPRGAARSRGPATFHMVRVLG